MSLLNPVRSTLKTTTRSIQPRTISTTASKHALNIYVRWDDPSNHAKFDEAKVRAFFSYKGFETRQIVPLNNADRIGKGVNSALVEIRDEEVDRCLKLDYGTWVSVQPYQPRPPKPPSGSLATKTLAIRGVPLGSDQSGCKDPHHTQRQLARLILGETGVVIGNAKTLRERVGKDGRTTVHVFVRKEEDFNTLLEWDAPEGISVEQLPKSCQLVQAFDKTKLFSDISTPLLPLPPLSTSELRWQPATRSVSTAPPTRRASSTSNGTSTSSPFDLAALSPEQRSQLRTTGRRRQVGFGRSLANVMTGNPFAPATATANWSLADSTSTASSSSSSASPSTPSSSHNQSQSTQTVHDSSSAETNFDPDSFFLHQHQASDANYSISSSSPFDSDSLFPTPSTSSASSTYHPPASSLSPTIPDSRNSSEQEDDMDRDKPFKPAQLAPDDAWRGSGGGGLMDPDGEIFTGSNASGLGKSEEVGEGTIQEGLKAGRLSDR